jgi:protein-S-isoprenylcysteine O-methyltransferase Ste14
MDIARWLSVGLGGFNVVVFAVGSVLFFRKLDSPPPPSQRLLGLAALGAGGCVVWAVVTSPMPGEVRTGAAWAGFGLSLGIFVWALYTHREFRLHRAFYEVSPERLVSSGPYRFVRHPFYLSYLLTYLGAAVLTAHVAVVISLCVMLGIYVAAARLEERLFLEGPWREEYRAYRARTGMFLLNPLKVLRAWRDGRGEMAR